MGFYDEKGRWAQFGAGQVNQFAFLEFMYLVS
jgi:hypothetical protein